MDISKADRFLYRNASTNKTYISKDLDRLLEVVPSKTVSSCFAKVNTESGPILFEMDVDYSGEPIIMRRFMHFLSFEKWYGKTFIEL